MINIGSITKNEKEMEFEVNGFPGFFVTLTYLGKEALRKLNQQFTEVEFKGGAAIEKFNSEEAQTEYLRKVITGWKGLKFKYLRKLLVIDANAAEDDAEVEFSEQNALDLVKGSNSFDNWVNKQLSDVSNFTKRSSEESESE